MRIRVAFLVLGLCTVASVSVAQVRSGTVEISPFAGYLWGGDFPAGSNALFTQRVDVRDHLTYGVGVGYFLNSTVEFEARWARTETGFENHNGGSPIFGPGTSNPTLADLTIDYIMGYSTFNFGHHRAVPYVTVGMGAAILNPGPRRDIVCGTPTVPCVDPTTSTRYTASVGGGVKIYVNRYFGFDFDARYFGTYLNSGGCNFHDGHTHCNGSGSNWLSNFDTTGGLVISF